MARSKDIFQLSKRRLRENPKFCALTPSEKWFWLDLCMFLDEQEQPGVARWDLDRLARARHAPVDGYRSLVKQEVLKGAPAGEDCAPYVHVDRNGTEHMLIPAQPGPIWYSSAIVRDEHLRQVASRAGREGGGNPHLQSDTFKGRSKGVVKGAPKGVEPDPSPPRGSSPTPLSPNPTPTPIPVAAQPSAAVASGGSSRSRRAATANGEQKPPAEFTRLTNRWQELRRDVDGVDPENVKFERVEGVIIASLWNRMSFHLERSIRVMEAYFADRDPRYEGHPANLFKRDMDKFIARAGRNGTQHGPGKPTAADRSLQRGDFPEAVAGRVLTGRRGGPTGPHAGVGSEDGAAGG